MSLLYDLLGMGLLGIIAFQDFKYKAVSWIVFPILFLLSVLSVLQESAFEYVAGQLMLNLIFIAFQLFILTVYFTIKNRKFINIGKNYLGLGDILFFVVLAASFSFLNFVFIYILSLFGIAIIYMLYRIIKKNAAEKIPLAGGMAIVMISCLLFKNSTVNFNFYDDTYALAFLSGLII